MTAPFVRRIFAEYLGGRSLREIADDLNYDGVPCPSAHRPEQNPHRRGDGWQISTLSVILSNQRYTGYEYWGKWGRIEELIDPNDVSLGYRTRFRRAQENSGIRSRKMAHEPLVSVTDFIAAQQITDRRGGARERGARGREKSRPSNHAVALRGVLRCRICGRKMEPSMRRGLLYYRCRSRDLVPGSEIYASHPDNFYVRHDDLAPGLHDWLGSTFAPENRERTIRLLLDAQQRPLLDDDGGTRREFETRRGELKVRLGRLQEAIEAGADLAPLVGRLNAVHAELRAIEAASAAQEAEAAGPALDENALRSMLESLGDISRKVFDEAEPAVLAEFYRLIGLKVSYDQASGTAEATATLPSSRELASVGGVAGVRGGT